MMVYIGYKPYKYSKYFTLNKSFKNDIMVNSGEKQYSNLINRMSIYTEIRPYKCSPCADNVI